MTTPTLSSALPAADAAPRRPVRVASVNVNILGHVTYQNLLERAFADPSAGVDFRSFRLTSEGRRDNVGRAAYWLLSRRLPGAGASDSDYIRYRTEMALSFKTRRLAERLVREHAPDVLHLHTQCLALQAAPLMRRVPTVISIDCTTALLLTMRGATERRTYAPTIQAEREAFRAAAHVVSFTEVARRSVIEDYGVSPERVTTVYPALDVPPAAAESAPSRRPGGKLRLLFVGNDFVRKGGELLLRVYGERFADTCELDIVSNAEIAVPLPPGARQHKGLRPLDDNLMRLYGEADVFVLPTSEDCFGWVFVEAMIAGLPCIGTQVLGVPEAVQDGVNGITIPVGDAGALTDAIGSLVGSPDLRRELGARGRRRAETEFNARINYPRFADILRDAARGRR